MNRSLIRIALRNLWEHKSKTLILGFLITFGVLLIITGNSFLNASRKNTETMFVENYTGDILIHTKSKYYISLFGASSMVSAGTMPTVPALIDTQEIIDIVSQNAQTKGITTAICGLARLKGANISDDWEPAEENEAMMLYTNFLAGNPETYFDVFPAVKIIEGDYPSASQPSIIISKKMKEDFEKYYEKPLAVGDAIELESFTGGNKIRELRVSGFFEPTRTDSSISTLSYIDQNTARSLNDITLGSILAQELPESIDTGIMSFSDDDLFGSDDFLFDSGEEVVFDGLITSEAVDTILGDTAQRDLLNQTAHEAWNFVQVQLTDSADAPKTIAALNAIFTEKNMPVLAIDWKTAGSGFAQMADMLGGVFNVLMVILAIVVFIVIMNTLIVSIIERVGEIGTMRAIGSSRTFIRYLFFTESVSITCIASVAGIVLSLLLTGILNGLHITVTNETAMMLLGGNLIHLTPSIGNIIITFTVVLFVSIIANIYPVSVALRISPLRAMNNQ